MAILNAIFTLILIYWIVRGIKAIVNFCIVRPIKWIYNSIATRHAMSKKMCLLKNGKFFGHCGSGEAIIYCDKCGSKCSTKVKPSILEPVETINAY